MPHDLPINIDEVSQSIDIERIAEKAIAKLGSIYSDKAHFVYELVQNAADTSTGAGEGVLGIVLKEDALLAWNRGRPFDASDIKAICSVGESTKDLTKIGTHGIGFKSVYWCTDTPEIYSGETCFRIRQYIRPESLSQPNEELQQRAREGRTTFLLPFKDRFNQEGRDKIGNELCHLSRWTLLFLGHLKQIEWQDERTGKEGRYTRHERPAEITDATRVGLIYGGNADAETFLVFARSAKPPALVIEHLLAQSEDDEERKKIERSAEQKQRIEIAFSFSDKGVVSLDNAVLFSYLPTEVSTGLRFLVQARYQTTPARDNIVTGDDSRWNAWLVAETGALLRSSLVSLRDAGGLTLSVFEALPNGKDKAPDSAAHIFEPIREATIAALQEEPLIPAENGEYLLPEQVRVPVPPVLRDLLETTDLAEIAGAVGAAWLDPTIKWGERTATLLKEAGVKEVRTAHVVAWLQGRSAEWFAQRGTAWLRKMLVFLADQKAERESLLSIPLIRLHTGEHLSPRAGNAWVFFAPEQQSGVEALPVLHSDLRPRGNEPEYEAFLLEMGVRKPEPENILRGWLLPQYKPLNKSITVAVNRQHLHLFRHLLNRVAFDQKSAVLKEFQSLPFLLAKKADTPDALYFQRPEKAYLPKFYSGDSDLEIYFQPSPSTYFIDAGYAENDDVNEWKTLFTELGVFSVPRCISHQAKNTPKLSVGKNVVGGYDWELEGLESLLRSIEVDAAEADEVCNALWRLLIRRVGRTDQNGRSLFESVQTVSKPFAARASRDESETVPAAFVERLKKAAWLRDTSGKRCAPQDLYAATNEIKRVLGDSVSYIHPDYAVGSGDSKEKTLAGILGVNLTVTVAQALNRLRFIAGKPVTDDTPRVLYRFLRDGQMSGRDELFAAEPLLYTPEPEPTWWKSGQVFWTENTALFGNRRGYIAPYYATDNLQTFFTSVGVGEPAFDDYANVAREIAAEGSTDEATRNRMVLLYRRIAAMLQESSLHEKSPAWHWLREGACWLGRVGEEWVFVNRTQLVRDDHNYKATLFQDCLPFWMYDDLTNFATDELEITSVSAARPSFYTVGDKIDAEKYSQKLVGVAPFIEQFLTSPTWCEERTESSGIAILPTLQTKVVDELSVSYSLLGETVTDPEPLRSFLDARTYTVWLASDANEDEYPKLIGDALQRYYNVRELREFVSDLLFAGNVATVLKDWQRRGLQMPQTPSEKQASSEPRIEATSANITQVINADDVSTENESAPDTHSATADVRNVFHPAIRKPVPSAQNEESHRPSPALAKATAPIRRTPPLSAPERLKRLAAQAETGDGESRPVRSESVAVSGGDGYGGTAGGGGEGEYHKALKEWVCENPEMLGEGLRLARKEFVFLSGDKVDVLLEDAEGRVTTVEVKPEILPGDEKGVWQAIKYKHLAAVEWEVRCSDVVSFLVAPRIPDGIKARCRKYGVTPFEVAELIKDASPEEAQ